MKNLFPVTLICVALVSPVIAQEKAPANPYEKTIIAFEAGDKANPPPKNGVLFVGASGIKLWTSVAQDFPEYKVINRGFGGSQISDNIYYADRIMIPYEPKVVVFQAGGNDLNAGKSVEQVTADFKTLVEKIHAKLPQTTIVFMSIQPSPKRWEQREKQQDVNARIAKYIAGQKNLVYLNAWDSFLNSEGQPRSELFVADMLHHNAEGYKVRTAITKPVLDKLLK